LVESGIRIETARMKHEQVLKSFSALSFDGKAVTGAPLPAPNATPARSASDEDQSHEVATLSDQFREMLYQRYAAPYPFASAYRHWGINE
jgi:hypothetical protein